MNLPQPLLASIDRAVRRKHEGAPIWQYFDERLRRPEQARAGLPIVPVPAVDASDAVSDTLTRHKPSPQTAVYVHGPFCSSSCTFCGYCRKVVEDTDCPPTPALSEWGHMCVSFTRRTDLLEWLLSSQTHRLGQLWKGTSLANLAVMRRHYLLAAVVLQSTTAFGQTPTQPPPPTPDGYPPTYAPGPQYPGQPVYPYPPPASSSQVPGQLRYPDARGAQPPAVSTEQAPPPVGPRWIIKVNPIGLLMQRYSFDLEGLVAPHHALFVAPHYWHNREVHSDNCEWFCWESFDAVGGEFGYRFYTSSTKPAGFWIGPTIIGDAVKLGKSNSYNDYALQVAVDLGGQFVFPTSDTGAGIVFGFGGGLVLKQKLSYSESRDVTLDFPIRLLLQVGYAF